MSGAVAPTPFTSGPSAGAPDIEEVEHARMRLYRLLGACLAAPPAHELLQRLTTLDGATGELGGALRDLAGIAAELTPQEAASEYDAVFVGMTRGEVVPYASFYLTGFLYERPLARLREEMDRLGLAPTDGRSDPEDHAATMCEIMSWLIEQRAADEQRGFFKRHLDPWLARFFADVEAAPSAQLYRRVGTLGRLLVGIDREAFQMEVA